MQEGLYKVDFHTVHGTGSGVLYAIGGQAARRQFRLRVPRQLQPATATVSTAKISTLRHNDDPGFKPLFGTDMITLTLKGVQ